MMLPRGEGASAVQKAGPIADRELIMDLRTAVVVLEFYYQVLVFVQTQPPASKRLTPPKVVAMLQFRW